MQKITNNIYVETGFHGCNTSLVVTSDGVVVIDTPMVPSEAKTWNAQAKKFGPIRYVINTEPHTDHAMGNYWFGAPVVAHEGTRQELLKARVEEFSGQLQWMAPDSLPLDPAFQIRYPEITFSQNLTLYLGQHTLQLLNMPGHTASELAIYVPEEKTLFTGDNINRALPIFIKSWPYAWLESLKKLGSFEADIVVPGHGEVGDKSCLITMAENVQYWIDLIKPLVEKGLSLEETLATVDLKKKYPVLVNNPGMNTMVRNSITDVYRALGGRSGST